MLPGSGHLLSRCIHRSRTFLKEWLENAVASQTAGFVRYSKNLSLSCLTSSFSGHREN